MTFSRILLAAVVLIACVAPAAAETKLTEFNGEWRGSGQDRNFPLEAAQPVSCQTIVRATLQRMHSEMICERLSGLRKIVRMTVLLEGDQFTGRITQRKQQTDREDEVINGVLSGQRTANTANFLVRWSGATPNTTVDLKLLNPTSYVMRVTALAMNMMDVSFTRTSDRAPPR